MKFCVYGGLGDTLNKQRRKPNGYPGALLATMSLTLERRKETALLRGSNLSYNEGVIGLTGHCLSFHARTGKL